MEFFSEVNMNTCSHNQLMDAFTTELTKYHHAELSDLILKTYGIYKYTAVNHYLIIMCLVYRPNKKKSDIYNKKYTANYNFL